MMPNIDTLHMVAFGLDGTALILMMGTLIAGMWMKGDKGWMTIGLFLVVCMVTSLFAIVL